MPDFGVYIKVQGASGDVEYRSLSRQLVLFCVERRKAWRMLQSKAGIENREYKAQRSLLADVDAGRIRNELVVYQGAPHSFFDRAFTDYSRASQDAWSRVLAFIHRDPGDGLQPRPGSLP